MKFRIYYTANNGVLELTSTENYMKKVLDKDKSSVNTPTKGNVIAVLRPYQMVLEKGLFKLNMLENSAEASFKNFGTIQLLNILFPKTKNLEKKSMEIFGFKPVCPMGGEYKIDKRSGKVSNTVFGNRYKKIIDEKNIKSDILSRYFSTKEFKVELEFTEEGIKTRIITR